MYLAEEADYSRYGASYRATRFANCTSLEKVTLSENTLFHGEFFTVAKKYIFTHLRQAMK